MVGVVAPAGYGNTTLFAQWAQRTARRVGWVSVDPRDNDPAVLLTYIAVALDRVEPIAPGLLAGWPGRAPRSWVRWPGWPRRWWP